MQTNRYQGLVEFVWRWYGTRLEPNPSIGPMVVVPRALVDWCLLVGELPSGCEVPPELPTASRLTAMRRGDGQAICGDSHYGWEFHVPAPELEKDDPVVHYDSQPTRFTVSQCLFGAAVAATVEAVTLEMAEGPFGDFNALPGFPRITWLAAEAVPLIRRLASPLLPVLRPWSIVASDGNGGALWEAEYLEADDVLFMITGPADRPEWIGAVFRTADAEAGMLPSLRR